MQEQSKLLSTTKSHNRWKIEEDERLNNSVEIHGPNKWKSIATEVGTRDAKQCRERYHGHLAPNINKNPLTQEEDDIVVRDRNLGYGWAQIARNINETLRTLRTPNQLKNNFNQRLKRLNRSGVLKPDVKHISATKKSKPKPKEVLEQVPQMLPIPQMPMSPISPMSSMINSSNYGHLSQEEFYLYFQT